MSHELAVQKAIFARLTESSDIPDVYDNVPQKDGRITATWPFVVVGEDTSIAWDTDDSVGAEVTVTVHAWTRYGGRAAAKVLQGRIYDLIHRHDFQLDGYAAVTVDFEYSEVLEEGDQVTFHGVQRFRVLLERPE
jgi:hypothetical protein